MVAVSIDKIDALNPMVEKLRVITFLQKLIINEFIDDDTTLKGLELKTEAVGYFLAEENFNTLLEIRAMLSSDDFYQIIK